MHDLRSSWIRWPDDIPVPDPLPPGCRTINRHVHIHASAVLDLPLTVRLALRTAPRLWSYSHAGVTFPDLRPYQHEAAGFAASRDASLLALSMGLGQTRTALAAAWPNGTTGVGVIVAPRVTVPVWQRECALVLGIEPTVVRGRTLLQTGVLMAPGIYLINPEILSDRLSEWSDGIDWVILDEVHLYVNGRTVRSKAAANLAATARHRIALTGTPIIRHPMDLHGVVSSVAPQALGSWSSFAAALGLERSAHGWVLSDPDSAHQAWLRERLEPVMFVRRWTDPDVGLDVPPIAREKVPVVLPEDRMRAYLAAERDARAFVGGLDHLPFSRLAAITKLRQVGAMQRKIGEAKVDAALQLLSTISEPVVVWAWYRKCVDRLRVGLERLGRRVAVVTGETSPRLRDAEISRFQDGGADVIILTYAVGGVGVDLTRARATVFAELAGDWTPSTMAQAEARVFRSTQRQACMTYWLFAAGTIEERMVEVLLQKAAHANVDVFPDFGDAVDDWDPDIALGSLLEAAEAAG